METDNSVLDISVNDDIQQAEEWSRERHKYANKIVHEGTRKQLNHYIPLNIQLWSDAPEVEEFTTDLAIELWGKSPKKRHNHLRVVLMNLWDTWNKDPTRYIAYQRNNSHYPKIPSRYNPVHITKLLILIMDALINAELIEHNIGKYNVEYSMGYVSKCRATPDFIDRMVDYGIEPSMVCLHPGTELIQLRSKKSVKHTGNGNIVKTKGVLLGYQDTPETVQKRGFLHAYNAFIRQHDIRVPALPIPDSKEVFRVFNNRSWDEGGRFTGGWWMGAKNNTRKDIMINGQPTLELDYGCCMPSLMYAQRGIEPLGDIYQIDGFNREIVKIAFMRAINNKGKGRAINSLKKAIQKEYPELEDLVDCEALMERIVDQHLFISDLFFQKYGNFLMSLESDICELILKTLTSEGICCLSIHDSFIVQKVYERRLRKVMVESFRQIMDVPYTPLIK